MTKTEERATRAKADEEERADAGAEWNEAQWAQWSAEARAAWARAREAEAEAREVAAEAQRAERAAGDE